MEERAMARRKLRGYLDDDEQELAVIRTHDAKDSMDAVYEEFRERFGAKHPLTIKAKQAAERVSAFKAKLWKAMWPYVK
jgi:hypothetical protein